MRGYRSRAAILRNPDKAVRRKLRKRAAAAPAWQRVVGFAIATRLAMAALLVLFDQLLPDHDPNVEVVWRHLLPSDPSVTSPSAAAWAAALSRPFTRWDSAHLLGVARDFYTTEASLAFFPFYPLTVHGIVAGTGITTQAGYVLTAVLVSNVCFVGAGTCLARAGRSQLVRPRARSTNPSALRPLHHATASAAFVLLQLGREVLQNEVLAIRGALLFCVTPGGVFFSTAYTESVFALTTFTAMWQLHEDKTDGCSGGYASFVSAGVAMLIASATRSNGTAFVAFLGAHVLVVAVEAYRGPRRVEPDIEPGSPVWYLTRHIGGYDILDWLQLCVAALVHCGMAVFPMFLFDRYSCTTTSQRHEPMSLRQHQHRHQPAALAPPPRTPPPPP